MAGRLPVLLLLIFSHELFEYRGVVVAYAKHLRQGHAERFKAHAVFSRESEPRADVSLIVYKECRERAVIGFQQSLIIFSRSAARARLKYRPFDFG